MHLRLGSGYVQQVMHAIGHPLKGSADSNAGLAAITADTTQERTQIAASLATDKDGIVHAIARGTGTELRTAAGAAADAIARADASVDASRTELDAMTADDKKSAEYATAAASTKALDDAINHRAVPVLDAIAVPGAPIKGAPPSDSLASAVRARAEHVRGEVDRVAQLVLSSQQAGSLVGGTRLAAADQVRTELLGMSAAERSWVIGRMAGVSDDILAYYKGNSAALRAQAGARDFGSGSNAAGDSSAQGGFSHGTQLPNMKSDQGAKGDPVTVPFTKNTPIPGGVKGVTADSSTGGLGVDVGGKKVAGGVGGDVRADDGSARLEGFNGNLSRGNGVEGKGAVSTKVNGGYTQTTSPPSFDGAHWTLSWSVGVSVGLGQTKTVADDKGTGTAASVSGKVSGSIVKNGTTVYADQAAAQKAYDDGAFALTGVKGMDTLPDKDAAKDLKDGESIDIAYQGDVAGGVGGGGSNVNISASAGGGLSTDVKVVKLPGNKVRATIRGVDNVQGSLGVGTVGLTGGVGAGGSKAISTTYDFDLSTPVGQAAYSQWVGNHPHLAPNPGPGITFVSSGSGEFTSTNAGIGVGAGPINGTGTNTSTSGEFTEKSADGTSQRNTVVGQQTDAVKGFNPIDPSKTVRTDSLEITTDSKTGVAQPAQYVIKTSIQSRTDAQAANTELGKVLGEPSAQGKLDGSASGTNGKWSVDGTYTAAQMKQFETDVASGKIPLIDNVATTGTPGATLKNVLSDPKSTEHDKQMALAAWFAKKGPDASAELRSALGPPQMNIALDGDTYLTGAQAQGVFEGKRQALEDRLLEPTLTGDAVKATPS